MPTAIAISNLPAHKLTFDASTGRVYVLNGTDTTIRYFVPGSPTVYSWGTLPVTGRLDDLSTDDEGRIYVTCMNGTAACSEGAVLRVDGLLPGSAPHALIQATAPVMAIAYPAVGRHLHVARLVDARVEIERVRILK